MSSQVQTLYALSALTATLGILSITFKRRLVDCLTIGSFALLVLQFLSMIEIQRF